mgnify:CR=1 FL=1
MTFFYNIVFFRKVVLSLVPPLTLIFVVLGLILMLLVSQPDPDLFRRYALLFLIFSLPAFIFIEEKFVSTEKVKISILNSLNVVIKSWKHTRQYKGLTRFLVGRFFYADAINTLISGLLAVYLVEEAGLTPADSQNILALAIVISIIGGYVFGKIFKGPKLTKFSPNKTYAGMIGGYLLSIISSIIIHVLFLTFPITFIT